MVIIQNFIGIEILDPRLNDNGREKRRGPRPIGVPQTDYGRTPYYARLRAHLLIM